MAQRHNGAKQRERRGGGKVKDWKESEMEAIEWIKKVGFACGIRMGIDTRNPHVYYAGHLKVLYSEENTPKWGWLKHLSVSHPLRYPYWDEIKEAKERFMGDIDVAMILPKKEDYINVHKNCFHLWEIPGGWGLQ